MTTVFIGGSRAISRLTSVVRTQLDDLLKRKCQFVIGDANGADRAVQQYLAGRGYRGVTIFCMDECRNNIGGWPIRRIKSGGGRRDFAYYSKKDLAMALEARCAMMLWDGKSRGTLNNVRNVIGLDKTVLLYIAPAKAFRKISNQDDIETLMRDGHPQVARGGKRRVQTPLAEEQSQFPLLP